MKTCIEKWTDNREILSKEKREILSKETRSKILMDVNTLQSAWNPECFNYLSNLFIDRWTDKGFPRFVEYFRKEWLTMNPNWYEGVARRCPSTNNALESFNGKIKKEATLREKLPISRFVSVLKNFVRDCSVTMKFSSEVVIGQQLWLDAYNYAKTKPALLKRRVGDMLMYWCPITADKLFDKKDTQKCIQNKWESLKEYRRNPVCFVDFISDNWMNSSCSCLPGQKHYVCVHILAIAIMKDMVIVPSHIKAVPIGAKIKRGRPAKCSKALSRK